MILFSCYHAHKDFRENENEEEKKVEYDGRNKDKKNNVSIITSFFLISLNENAFSNKCLYLSSVFKIFFFFFFFEDHKNSFTDTLIFLGDDLTLCEIEIADGEDIFVWNGVEVNKC